MVERSNSVLVSAELWAAVQLRRLVLVQLVVQGERLFRSVLRLLEVVQLEFRPSVHVGLAYPVLSDSSSFLKAIANFPLSPCRVI